MSGPLSVPSQVTGNGVAALVLQGSKARTRLLYLSCTNNDSAPRYIAIHENTAAPASADSRHLIGPIQPGATYVATDLDLGSNSEFDNGITVQLVAGRSTQGGGPKNSPVVVAGLSANWTAWIQAIP